MMRVTFQGFQRLSFPGLKGEALQRAAQRWEQEDPKTRCVKVLRDNAGQDHAFNFNNTDQPHCDFVLNMRRKWAALKQRVDDDAKCYEVHSPFVGTHHTIGAQEYYRRHPEVAVEEDAIHAQWEQFAAAVFAGEDAPLPPMDNSVDRFRKAFAAAK